MKSLMGTPSKHEDDAVGTGLIADRQLELKLSSLNKNNLLTSSTKKDFRAQPMKGIDQAKRMLFASDEVRKWLSWSLKQA